MDRPVKQPNASRAVIGGQPIPDWVPAPIVDLAIQLSQGCSEDELAVLHRLVFAEKMKFVWIELESHQHGSVSWGTVRERRSKEANDLRARGLISEADALDLEAAGALHEYEFLHNDVQRWGDRGTALRQLFLRAHIEACLRRVPDTVTKRESSVAEVKACAQGLLEIAKVLKKYHYFSDAEDHVAQAIEIIDIKLIGFASTVHDRTVVQRARGDAVLKNFVLRLSNITKDYFGSPLYGTLATIANVAFDRDDLTGPKVRQLLR